MTHTPGPWKIGYGGGTGDDFAVIVSPHRPRAICNLEPLDYDILNARLIAAAPDLLAALQQIAEIPCDHGAQEFCPRTLAREAIAKAEGKGTK